MSLTDPNKPEHPLDVIEALAGSKEWLVDRGDDDTLRMLVTGVWADYQISYTWMPDIEVLHLGCGFDFKVPGQVPEQVCRQLVELTALINRGLRLGHFDFWRDENMVLFRHGTPLVDASVDAEQCERIISVALQACEQHYPMFQYVLWAGKSAREAYDAVSFETDGTA